MTETDGQNRMSTHMKIEKQEYRAIISTLKFSIEDEDQLERSVPLILMILSDRQIGLKRISQAMKLSYDASIKYFTPVGTRQKPLHLICAQFRKLCCYSTSKFFYDPDRK